MIYLTTLKLIIRSWWRNKLFFLISLFSLTTGLACTILLFTYFMHEYGIESTNPKRDHIFCVRQDSPMEEDIKISYASASASALLKDKYSEIQEIVQINTVSNQYIQYKEEIFNGLNFICASPELIHFFDYKTVAGNIKEALTAPGKVAVSEATANKLFGTVPPLGQHIKGINDEGNISTYEVTAVFKERQQSLLHFDLLTSIDKDFFGGFTLLQLNNPQDAPILEKKIENDKVPTLAPGETHYYIEPLSEIYIKKPSTSDQQPLAFIQQSDIQLLHIGLFSAILVLLIACFNYANLSLSRILQQLRMINIEKMMGATLSILRHQLFLDIFLTVTIAFVFAILIISDVLPLFNGLLESHLSFSYFLSLQVLPVLFLLVLSLACFPALYASKKLTKLSISEFNSSYTGRRKQHLIVTLVTIQLIISIALIFASLMAEKQYKLVKNEGRHFSNCIEIGSMFSNPMETLRQQLKQIPGIEAMSVSGSSVLNGWMRELSVKAADGSTQRSNLLMYFSDEQFLETMQIKLMKGDKPKEALDKYAYPVWINEKYAQLLVPDNESPLGQKLNKYDEWANDSMSVIAGIVENTQTNTIEKNCVPMVITMVPSDKREVFNFMQIRIFPSKRAETLKAIRQTWNKLNPEKPFIYTDMYELFLNRNQKVTMMLDMLLFYSLISIFLTCFGLFGISWYATRQRMREIAIRKVHGASNWQILWLLYRPFLIQVSIAYLIAMPIAYSLIIHWLEQFAYRMDPDIWALITPLLLTSLVSIITISIHGIFTARINPINSLKVE